jgi:putative zinc finger protein
MSELNEMNCGEFQGVAAELALGVLTGRERAQAMAHLEHCEACRANVRQLTLTGEGLLGLLPAMEPPVGFETRVMDRIGLAAPAPAPAPARRVSWLPRFGRQGASQGGPGRPRQLSRTRRMFAVAAVALAVVAGGLGGWGLGNGASSPAGTPLHSAALESATHQPVGKIYLYQGHPQWMYMSVNMHSGRGTVLCQVRDRDGHFTTVGSFRLTNGYGYWGSPAPGAPGSLTGARLVTAGGTVLATATFQ